MILPINLKILNLLLMESRLEICGHSILCQYLTNIYVEAFLLYTIRILFLDHSSDDEMLEKWSRGNWKYITKRIQIL